jgi:signal transduction histidine kinase
MAASAANILVIDDDPLVRASTSGYLEDLGYNVQEADDGILGIESLKRQMPDLIITDIRMPHMDGLEVLKAVTKQYPELPIIVISGTGDLNDVVSALRFGVWDIILKPILNMDILGHSIKKALEKADLITRNRLNREQLEMANKELESFNYSISHDLRSPLHAIAGFSKILEEDCMDVLDDEHRDYLERIGRSVKRMNQMIDDLLTLSRLSQHDIEKEQINLSAVVSTIMGNIQASRPNLKLSVIIEKNVMVFADSGLISNVMENLLNNAIKYSGKVQNPVIEFGRVQTAKGPAVFVKDNGAGFDMKYAQKLFGVFQRLHRKEEFEGSGIGLATVRRIISKHGGSIWADAKPNEGATFYFTLPDF